jgi:hypothetical protein
MLSFDDPRWAGLTAGYKVAIDLRPLLHRLASAEDPSAAWDELWQELHHQGDIGEGSFVAVPHLVRIHRDRGTPDWNTYGLVSTIELARGKNGNPDVPAWIRADYERAIQDLAGVGLLDFPKVTDPEGVRSILALLALAKGARAYGHILLEFSEDELKELEEQAFGEER